jgi:dTDP-4-amino-4,6-dideoxygalactose transaminase
LRQHLELVAELANGRCVNRRTGRVIRALLPMHTFGHAVDIKGALAVAADFRLALVEDAAEALGTTILGRHAGTFGLLGTCSFNGNKTITTGGGGAILTDDPDLAKRAKHLMTTAKIAHPWAYVHDQIGFNYRMPNINAALGCAQLEQLPGFLRAQRAIAGKYQAALAGVRGVRLVTEPAGCHSNYWLQALLLDATIADQRDAVLAATNAMGLMTRPAWTPLHLLAPFRECPRMDLPIAEALARRLINLPSSARLGADAST